MRENKPFVPVSVRFMLGDGTFTPELYTLVDEEGNEHTFEALDSVEYDDVVYFAMIPYFEDPQESLESDVELIIMKLENVDGEDCFAPLDNQEEFDKMFAIFVERIEAMFDDEDDCDCGCCHHHDGDCDCDDCDCDDCDCDDDCCE